MNHNAEAYDLATRIKIVQGSQEYLKRVTANLSEGLITGGQQPRILVRPRGGGQARWMDTKIQTVPTMTTRRIRAVDLRRKRPDLYRRFVIETPPDNVFKVTMASAKGGAKSAEWAAWAKQGAVQAQQFERPYAHYTDADWRRPDLRAQVLRALRDVLKEQGLRERGLRAEFSAHVESDDWGLLIPGRTDGVIRVAANPPKMKTDYDGLEAAGGREFVTRSTTQGYSKIVFAEIAPDPEDEVEDTSDSSWL